MNADNERLHWDLSEAIIGAAMTVLNKLKPGLKEKAYENSLVIELRKRGHIVEQQRQFDVLYDGVVVDTLIPDIIVDGKVIVDPKVAESFTDTHMSQMIGYMAITRLELSLLLNFKHARLGWKRVARSHPRSSA